VEIEDGIFLEMRRAEVLRELEQAATAFSEYYGRKRFEVQVSDVSNLPENLTGMLKTSCRRAQSQHEAISGGAAITSSLDPSALSADTPLPEITR
jgi:hypothetical protein